MTDSGLWFRKGEECYEREKGKGGKSFDLYYEVGNSVSEQVAEADLLYGMILLKWSKIEICHILCVFCVVCRVLP